MSTHDLDNELPSADFQTNTTSNHAESMYEPPHVASSLQGRWLALAGVLLFAVSLPLAWTDTSDIPQYPSTLIFNYIIDGFGSNQVFMIRSYSFTNMLVYMLLGAIVLLGLVASGLCFTILARQALQLLSVWAVIATFFSAVLIYLSWEVGVGYTDYPNTSLRPNIGLGLALLALIVVWNSIRRLAFEWRVTDHDAAPSRAQPSHRWSVGIAILMGAFGIWLVSYFLLYWVVGAPCIRFLALSPLSASCWPRLKAMDTLAIVLNRLPYLTFQVANFTGIIMLVVIGCVALALIIIWRNGVTRQNIRWLVAALSLPTLLTLLSILGSAHTLAATPLAISLGLGIPLAFAALSVCWIGIIVLWREDTPAQSQQSIAYIDSHK